MESIDRDRWMTIDGWVFAAGGAMALVFTPILVDIAGGAEAFLMALAFGGFVGACDAARADSGMEAAMRTSLGVALGLMVAVALYFSPWLAGLVLGAGVVMSRWAWFPEEMKNHVAAALAVLVGAMSMWALPPSFQAGAPIGWLEYLPVLAWGLGGGLAAMTMQLPIRLPGADRGHSGVIRATLEDGRDADSRQRREIAELRDELLSSLSKSSDASIRHTVEAAADAWTEVDEQRRIIGRYTPEVRRKQIERRRQRLNAMIDDGPGSPAEVEEALAELDQELEQCEKLEGLSLSLQVRQERIRSAMERLRLDLLHRRCDGLYEARVSSQLEGLNDLVEAATLEREVMTELVFEE